MDVKFVVKADCRADNIDKIRTAEETAKMITILLKDWCGVIANVEVTGMTYIGGDGETDEADYRKE